MRTKRIVLAIANRANTVAFVIFAGAAIRDRRQRRLDQARGDKDQFLAEALLKIIEDYHVTAVVVEPGGRVERAVTRLGHTIRRISFAEAKKTLFPSERLSRADFFHRLAERFPFVKRLGRSIGATKRLATADPRQTVALIAAALALADAMREHQHK